MGCLHFAVLGLNTFVLCWLLFWISPVGCSGAVILSDELNIFMLPRYTIILYGWRTYSIRVSDLAL
jgi:hypothetical protein